MSQKISAIPRNWMFAEYLLDGNANDTNDGTKNNGTATNVPYANTDRGYQSQTWVFDGSTAYFKASTTLNQTFSVSCVFKQTATGTNERFIWAYGGDAGWNILIDAWVWASYGYRLVIRTCVHNVSNITIWDTGWTPVVGTTYHMAFTRNGTSVQLFIDGVLTASSSSFTSFVMTNGNLSIGVDGAYTSNPFNGTVWAFRMYNYILSAEEVSSLYKESRRLLGGKSMGGIMDGLSCYLDMNGDSNDVIGSVTSADTSMGYPSGRFGSCASFNGSSSKIDLSTPVVASWAFTFEGWINLNSLPSGSGIYNVMGNWNSGTGNGFYIDMLGSSYFGYTALRGTGYAVYNMNSLTTSVWHHLVYTFDGSSAHTLYIDGASVATGTGSIPATSDNMGVGYNRSLNSRFLNGKMEQVRFYPVCKDANSVKALFNASSNWIVYPWN